MPETVFDILYNATEGERRYYVYNVVSERERNDCSFLHWERNKETVVE